MFTSSSWLIDKAQQWQHHHRIGRWVAGTFTIEQRRKMMDEWANYLERLRTGVNAPAKRKLARRAA
jgi:hypothetical protein